MTMGEQDKSADFFATAFAALVLLPLALFLVFLLAVGYRFGWIKQGEIGGIFVLGMLVVLAAFWLLRANVKKAFLSKPQK